MENTPVTPQNRKASTDAEARTAKPEAKEYKLSFGGGLYLLVKPNGLKYWRMKYRFNGVEKSPFALGVYPQVSLKDARKQQTIAKELLAQGIDPNEHKKAAKQLEVAQIENTFEAVALEWMEKHPPHADVTANKNRWLLNFAFAVFGKKAITDITAPDVLGVCRKIEDSGRITTAHSVKSKCSQVFRYAIATGKATVDPTLSLRGALTPKVIQHRPSITDPKEVAQLMRSINGYQGQFVTICALKLAPLVFIRPGELRQALWEEIDLEAAEWRYRVSKTNTDHIVPLSAQALAILHELHAVTGRGKYVFPSIRVNTRPMSENTINSALRALGYESNEMCGHGFRAMARTILDEVLHYRIDVIEQQLAHAVKDVHGRAYNRTKHLTDDGYCRVKPQYKPQPEAMRDCASFDVSKTGRIAIANPPYSASELNDLLSRYEQKLFYHLVGCVACSFMDSRYCVDAFAIGSSYDAMLLVFDDAASKREALLNAVIKARISGRKVFIG